MAEVAGLGAKKSAGEDVFDATPDEVAKPVNGATAGQSKQLAIALSALSLE